MKLSQLVKTDRDVEITGISIDSRTVEKGNLFIALKGDKYDGHEYIREALEKGAAAVVSQDKSNFENIFAVENTRRFAAKAFSEWYGNPQKRLKIFGVTGTNGKSSVVALLDAIYKRAGVKTAVSGTLGSFWDGVLLSSQNTTELPERLYGILKGMADDGVKVLFMEVSSHALALDRVSEISFACGIYTNLTTEHTDFHKTLENYAAAKAKLFEASRYGVFNYDDNACFNASRACSCEAYGFGKNGLSDFRIDSIYKNSLEGIGYSVVKNRCRFNIESSIIGEFNVYNTLAAASAAIIDGVDTDVVCEAIKGFRGITGRCETVYSGEFTVIVDYAHTPDALASVLGILKACKNDGQNRLRVLFGCGGDRDKSKRPLMGRIAEDICDEVILTADNSRGENLSDILNDILSGMKRRNEQNKTVIIEKRREALIYAVKSALVGDIILVAGKGHENYEIDSTGRHPFFEKEILLSAIKEKLNEKREKDLR